MDASTLLAAFTEFCAGRKLDARTAWESGTFELEGLLFEVAYHADVHPHRALIAAHAPPVAPAHHAALLVECLTANQALVVTRAPFMWAEHPVSGVLVLMSTVAIGTVTAEALDRHVSRMQRAVQCLTEVDRNGGARAELLQMRV